MGFFPLAEKLLCQQFGAYIIPVIFPRRDSFSASFWIILSGLTHLPTLGKPSWSRRDHTLLGPACVACPLVGQGVGSCDWQLHKTIWDAELGVMTCSWGRGRCYWKKGKEPLWMSTRLSERKSLSRVWLFVIPWTIQSMEFSRPEYWNTRVAKLCLTLLWLHGL